MKSTGAASARARIENVVIYAVFGVYLLFMLRLLILSRISLSDLTGGLGAVKRSVNLIPLGSILAYARGGLGAAERFAFSNVAGNVLAFVPLGAYLALLRRDKRVTRNLLLIFTASLLVEVVQGLFGIGTADVDDLILNCLGGLAGLWGYRLLRLVLRSERRARTAIAILSAMGLPVLLYYTFVIKLRL